MPRPPKRGQDVLSTLRDNLAREIEQRGGNMKAASVQAGVGETFARDVIVRKQDPKISNLVMLARKLGISIDRLVGLSSAADPADTAAEIKIVGEVGAGVWREVDDSGQIDFEKESSPFPPDPHYPISAQFDLVVRGTSINRFARDGERLRCVDVVKAGIDVLDNDLVIFRKVSGSLIETTAKRIRKRGPIIELWPDSDDARWQTPLKLDTREADPDHAEGQVVALVLYSYNPAIARRR